MARLLLDPACVLSAWEQMGGCAFSSDDVHLDDPTAITLDLSSWEAQLKPATAAPAPPPLEDNIFTSFFNPTAEFGLSFIPSCCAVAPAQAITQATTAAGSIGCGGPATGDGAAQVVPHCPTSSTGACSAEDTTLIGSAATHFDDDGVMSLQFSDMEAAMLSASPTSSCEAGVVPDFQRSPKLRQQEYCSLGNTATSAPPMSGSFFVPVSGGEAAAWCNQGGATMGGGCGVQFCKQEELPSAGELGPMQPTQPVKAEGAAETAASAPGQLAPAGLPQHVHQPPKQAAAPPAALLTTRGSSAAAAMAAGSGAQAGSGQGPQGATAPYIRTRAECLERYRQKKARRMYTKKIRYQLRKINADKRPRIKGRFVKKEELEDFLAAQRGSSHVTLADDVGDLYFGEDLMQSDEE